MSSAAETRMHVRGDSIARTRVPNSLRDSPRKGGPLTGTSGGSSDKRGISTAPSGNGFSIPPKLALRLIAGSLALFLLIHFSHPVLFGDSLAQHAKERKTRMQGAGESWILPRKWREAHIEAGEGEVTVGGETLPECKRIMLFRFSDTHGFSSEILHYLRSIVVANKLGYVLLADDSTWNYGSLTDYFLPRLVYCRPPKNWFDRTKATKVGTRRWQGKDRVWVGRTMEEETDEWIRDEMLDPHAMDDLRNRPSVGAVLPEGQSLPPPFEEVFADFSSALKEVWRPNEQLANLIRKQRMELGLGGGSVRHRKHSPTWGGNRRGGSRGSSTIDEDEDADQEEWEYDVNERGDRGPVVGVHLGGPQKVDLSLYGLEKAAKAGNLSAVYDGVADAVRRLSHNSIASPSYSRTRSTLFPPTSTATLVALTSNSTLYDAFSSVPAGAAYNLLRTSPPSQTDLLRWNDILRLELTEDLAPPKGDAGRLLREWDQGVWNDDVPRGLKTLLTRHFVRDLQVLSQYADAFVVSGASPTGRLALLLAGEEGALGPRDFNGGAFGGRVRSVDGYWVPTSKAARVWG
ncbi:hypothetical protein JCM10207_009185 [Rhodosporidiobolus poonsookiae]